MLQTNSTKFRMLLFIPLIFAFGCETGTNDEVELGSDLFGAVGQDMPIQEIIAQTFVLQNTEALLTATRLTGEMKSPPYTFFDPWDNAFERLPYWRKITRNRAWYGHLRDLALGHMHEGNLPKAEIDDGMTVTMMNGDTATVTKVSNRIRVDGILVIADTPASDGYLYMLDGVREPRWRKRTILDVINSNERFSTLAQILNHPSMSAKRLELASTTAELTFFAPTNEALAGFDIARCEEPECSALLKRIVENHLVGALVPRMYTQTKRFPTQSGSSLDWNYNAQSVTCTNADETRQEAGLGEAQEEYALNGIVQPMNALLCTQIPRCATECAPDQQCGTIEDGCGGTIDCGECAAGQICENHRCVEDNPGYQCEIVCTEGKVVADYCEETMTTSDEDACDQKRDLCCVDDMTPCPTLCDENEKFVKDVYLYWDDMTCGEYMDSLTPTDPACTYPLPHVPDECCSNAFPSSPPAAPNPCYDLCGDDRQMVGSRVLDEHMMTCFDYARSTNADDSQCTSPDPSIVDRCCDSPRPLPKPVSNWCCLCDGCYGTLADRNYHKIGPDGLTCVEMDFRITTEHKYGDPECSAKQEAFSATCCDAGFDPPPDVPGEDEDSGQPNVCNVPDPPAYCQDYFPRCDICGNGRYPKNPYNVATIATIPGNPTCADLYWMGHYGGIPAAVCYPIQTFLAESCGCL